MEKFLVAATWFKDFEAVSCPSLNINKELAN